MAKSTLHSFADHSIITLCGTVSPTDVIESLSEHAADLKSPNVVWNFLDAEIAVVAPQDFKDLARAADEILQGLFKSRRRTALVTRSQLRGMTFSIYITVANSEKVPADYQVFRNLEDAVKWVTQPA